MMDFVLVIVLLAIIGAAGMYIWKAKKNGVKCIGCPDGAKCSGKCSGDECASCHCHMEK